MTQKLCMSFGELLQLPAVPDLGFFGKIRSQSHNGHVATIARSKMVQGALIHALQYKWIRIPSGKRLAAEVAAMWRSYCDHKRIPYVCMRQYDRGKYFEVLSDTESTYYHGARTYRISEEQLARLKKLWLTLERSRKAILFSGDTSVHATQIKNPIDASGFAYQLTQAYQKPLLAVRSMNDWMATWKEERLKENSMVKMFKDGKALALQTDATDERRFTQDFAYALSDYMTSPKFEGQHEVESWLSGYAEICCKMRGYKSEVKEQRVLTFGDVNPNSESLVSVAENRQAKQLETVA